MTTSERESSRTEVALKVLARASVGEKSGVLAKMHVAGPKLMLRRHAMMLALLIAPFAAVGQAQAACLPPSTASNNPNVACTGDTKNSSPDHLNGYGTINDNNNTYYINAGATVTGDRSGIVLGTGGGLSTIPAPSRVQIRLVSMLPILLTKLP